MGVSLPLPPYPAELNRALASVDALDTGDGAKVGAVVEASSRFAFGARMPNHRETLAFCVSIGLLTEKSGRVRVSALGTAFLARNPDWTYELTFEQKELLVEQCLPASPYAPWVTDLLRALRADSERETFVGSTFDREDYGRFGEHMVGFLRGIGLIEIAGQEIFAGTKFIPSISRLRSRVPMTAQELEVLLALQSVQGSAAEDWVVAHERQRLRNAGCPAEADAVRRISQMDVCAGYDIESFDGAASPFRFNRFIEVKSSSQIGSKTFIWSRNEKAVATRLRAAYWVYLLTGAGLTAMSEPRLLAIQDPMGEIRAGRLRLSPMSFEVSIL